MVVLTFIHRPYSSSIIFEHTIHTEPILGPACLNVVKSNMCYEFSFVIKLNLYVHYGHLYPPNNHIPQTFILAQKSLRWLHISQTRTYARRRQRQWNRFSFWLHAGYIVWYVQKMIFHLCYQQHIVCMWIWVVVYPFYDECTHAAFRVRFSAMYINCIYCGCAVSEWHQRYLLCIISMLGYFSLATNGLDDCTVTHIRTSAQRSALFFFLYFSSFY